MVAVAFPPIHPGWGLPPGSHFLQFKILWLFDLSPYSLQSLHSFLARVGTLSFLKMLSILAQPLSDLARFLLIWDWWRSLGLPLPNSHLVYHQIVLHVEEVDAVMHYTVLLIGICNCLWQFQVGLPFCTWRQVFLWHSLLQHRKLMVPMSLCRGCAKLCHSGLPMIVLVIQDGRLLVLIHESLEWLFNWPRFFKSMIKSHIGCESPSSMN